MRLKKRIGVDFDNTIIDYDRVFFSVALRQGLVDERCLGGKKAVREAIRDMPDGEIAWQRLQGQVYGGSIHDAVLFDGVEAFLRQCRAEGHSVLIVSHKTEYGHFDAARINLRQAALDWMATWGFFDDETIAIATADVFFESTRADKLKRIAALDCTHFIDDLPEVLDDPAFPPGVVKILFTNGELPQGARADAFAHWRDITEAVLA